MGEQPAEGVGSEPGSLPSGEQGEVGVRGQGGSCARCVRRMANNNTEGSSQFLSQRLAPGLHLIKTVIFLKSIKNTLTPLKSLK